MNIKKTTKTGTFTEISYTRRTDNQQTYYKSGKRSAKAVTSSEKQRRQNIKNANKRLKRLVLGNFKEKCDFFSTFTFSKAVDLNEAKQSIRQFIESLRSVYASEGVPLKYIYVIERGEKSKRLHVHFVLSNCRRSEIMSAWEAVQNAGKSNVQTMKNVDDAIEYLTKAPVGKQRYTSSRNLTRPVEQSEQVSEKEHRAALAAAILDDKAGMSRICEEHNPHEAYTYRNPVTGCRGVYFSYFEDSDNKRQRPSLSKTEERPSSYAWHRTERSSSNMIN